MYEQSKAAKRRFRDGDFHARYFVGEGIDVGAGPDSLSRYVGVFPAMRAVRGWDMPDGDAQVLASVPDNSYDFLHASHCLEHMRDPHVALGHWLRVVRPGGHVVVTIPEEDLYERGVFPSRFNSDHKWTFAMHKPAGSSWSPRSVNVLDMLAQVSAQAEVLRVVLLEEFCDLSLPATQDLTHLPNAECAIEFVLRKRNTGALAVPGLSTSGAGVSVGHGGHVGNLGHVGGAAGGGPVANAAPTVQASLAVKPALVEPQVDGVGRFDAPGGLAALRLFEAGQGLESERRALEALLLEPADCVAMDVLVRRYLRTARYQDCAQILTRLVRYVADQPAHWNNLGCCQAELGQLTAAQVSFERAIQCDPNYLPSYAGQAAMHYALGDAAGSEAAYVQILQRQPGDLDAQVNWVNSLLAQEKLEEAQAAMQAPRSQLAPDLEGPLLQTLPAPRSASDRPWAGRVDNQAIFESAHARMGMGELSLGNYATGLPLMERRLSSALVAGFDDQRVQRLWRGEPLQGRSLLLLWEQGYGDVFQALRHVSWLVQAGAKVLLPADEATRPLFEQSFAAFGKAVQVVGWRGLVPEFDFYISMLSLHDRAQRAGQVQPQLQDAYLFADEERVAHFKALRAQEPALAVGVVWAGRPELMLDAQRSLSEKNVRALTAPQTGVRFYSLQLGVRALECTHLADQGVVDWSVSLESFADTAAAMRALDVVVCVDTAAVHLAGALGVPAWLLNRFGSEYRWGYGRDDGVWYRSVRQARQTQAKDWAAPLAQVRAALAAQAAASGLRAPVPSAVEPLGVGEARTLMGRIEAALTRRELPEAKTLIAAYRAEYGESARLFCHEGVLTIFEDEGPESRARASASFDKALAVQPDYAVAFSNRASVQPVEDHQARMMDLLRSVAFNPAFAAGWANLARHERTQGRLKLAAQHARRAQLLQPADEALRLLRGETAMEAGDFEDARAQFESLRDARPDQADSYANMIPVLGLSEMRAEALAALNRALEIDPSHLGALNNGVQFHLRAQQFDQALVLADRYVAAAPEQANSHVMQALALHNLKRYDEAQTSLATALKIEPNNLEGLFALGTVYERIDRIADSETVLRQAIAVKRDYRSLVNLAVTLNRQQKYDEARQLNDEALASAGERLARELEARMANSRKALAEHPFRAEMQTVDLTFGPDWNNALIDLVCGDYVRGLEGYELRLKHQTITGMTHADLQTLRWRGEPLSGRRILLLPEQGYGDVVQFVRYVAQLKRRGATVLIGGSAPLETLLRATPGIDEVIPVECAQRPSFDYWTPVMSLAHHLGVQSAGDFLPELPYIGAPPAARTRWSQRIQALGKQPKVGLVWAGRRIYPADRLRSIDLPLLQAAIERPGVDYVSLQVGDAAPESAQWPGLLDWSAELTDFAETAALIEQLDLVIAVDTGVCHLAGALGKPVWMLNRVSTDWRWGATGASTAWYPSMRIFRQQQMLDWTGPLNELGKALNVWLKKRRRP